MKRLTGLWLIPLLSAAARAVPPEWAYSQDVQVAKPGITRLRLPLETASKAQSGLADVRLVDQAGGEIAYFIEQPTLVRPEQAPLEQPSAQMVKGKSIFMGRVPDFIRQQGLERVFLQSPTDDFLKPLTIEGSKDGQAWTVLVRDVPIFKERNEIYSTSVSFKKGDWTFLRFTLDDSTTPPIRIQTVFAISGPQRAPNLESIEPIVSASENEARETVLQLALPVDNLMVESLRFETSDRTFRRRVNVFAKVFKDGVYREQVIATGELHRVSLPGASQAMERLDIPVHWASPSRELVIRIRNGDSRPLSVGRVFASAAPAEVVFDAPAAGTYALWVGNPAAQGKTYDVQSLREELSRAPAQTAALGALASNPAFKVPDILPQAASPGTDLDVSPWKFRKAITLPSERQPSGIYRVELDLEAAAHNEGRLAAIRVVQSGKQLPYILDQGGVSRAIDLSIEAVPTDQPKASRWKVALPFALMPMKELQITVGDALFQRQIQAYEEVLDVRGEKVRRPLAHAQWKRTGPQDDTDMSLLLYGPPQSTAIFIETDNGDNPPLQLKQVKGFYQTPRLLFKAPTSPEPLYLYYGQPDVAAPQYDLNLIAPQILAQVPVDATLGKEEVLKVTPWYEVPLPEGGMRWLFWIVMGLVVAGLLFVIVRLLPRERTDA
jgi:hypothetical protein